MGLQVKINGKFVKALGVIIDTDELDEPLKSVSSRNIEDVKFDDCYLSNKEAIEVIDNIANVFRNKQVIDKDYAI